MYQCIHIKCYQNSSICSENIEEKHIFTSIKGHNSFEKSDLIPQINSQDFEHKHNFDIDQGP